MYLMSKNVKLAQIDFDTMLFEVFRPDLMPFALRGNNVTLFTVRDWMNDRVLNLSRSNAKKIISACGYDQKDRIAMCCACKGLSLTDCYWLKYEQDTTTWEEVNLYKNSLSSAVATIALTGEYVSISGKPRTPELTNGGSYAKCWKRHKDGIYLYKSGSLQGTGKEHLVEVLCSDLLDTVDVEHIKYTLTETDGKQVSCCKNMTDENISICDMNYIFGYFNRNNKQQDLNRFLNNSPLYWKMLIIDYLIYNDDRHSGNWGVYFNANTGAILQLHPLFDHNLALDLHISGMSQVISGKSLEDVAHYAKKHCNLDVTKMKKIMLTKTIKNRFFEIFGSYQEYDAMLIRLNNYISW